MLLVAATPEPAAPGASADHLTQLAGTWTCRRGVNAITKLTVSADGDGVVMAEHGVLADDPFRVTESYRRDPASGGWRADVHPSANVTFAADAPAFTADQWTMQGKLTVRNAGSARPAVSDRAIRYVLAGDQMFYRGEPDDAAPHLVHGEACLRGDAPPEQAQCTARDTPARVLAAAEPDMPFAAEAARIEGNVSIIVSLDENSNVTSAVIDTSPSAIFNESALAAARGSRYQTAVSACRFVPSRYRFVVSYTRG